MYHTRYGRLYDKSAGSCYYEKATGPLREVQDIDRESLINYTGQIRKFHPDEILALSGFPDNFKWPVEFTLQKKFACIGNSVNVTVVKAVMKILFDSIPNLVLHPSKVKYTN